MLACSGLLWDSCSLRVYWDICRKCWSICNMHATRKTVERWLTLNRSHEPCPASDRVPLDMITSLKLLPIRRRYERHCYAVSPPMGVSSGSGQEEKVVELSFWLGLYIRSIHGCSFRCCYLLMELRKCKVWETSSPWLWVPNDCNVLLNIAFSSEIWRINTMYLANQILKNKVID